MAASNTVSNGTDSDPDITIILKTKYGTEYEVKRSVMSISNFVTLRAPEDWIDGMYRKLLALFSY